MLKTLARFNKRRATERSALVVLLVAFLGALLAQGPVSAEVSYDFLENAADGYWHSSRGNYEEETGGSWGHHLGAKGAAAYILNCTMENGTQYDKVMFTHPDNYGNGWMHGGFDSGDFGILPENKRITFRARVGFQAGAEQTNGVLFVAYVYDGTLRTIDSVYAIYDNKLNYLIGDLTPWAGQAVTIYIGADAGGDTWYDWACLTEAKIIVSDAGQPCQNPVLIDDFYGFSMEWFDRNDLPGKLADMGGKWARLTFPWDRVEPNHGDYSFYHEDYHVRAHQEKGLCSLGILGYHYDFIHGEWWAREATNDPDSFLSEWRDYVHLVVERYDGDDNYGVPETHPDYPDEATRHAIKQMPVKHWEIFNEPNTTTTWGQDVDPVKYARFLEAAYDEAKLADPGCTVTTGGFTHAYPDYISKYNGFEFIKRVFDEIGPTHADVLNFHFYPVNSKPEDFGVLTALEIAGSVMDEYGAQRRVWVTETGYGTVDPGQPPANGYVTEGDQADYLVRLFLLSLCTQYTEAVLLTSCIQDGYFVGHEIWSWFDEVGLIRESGEPKLAYGAVQNMITQLSGAYYVAQLTLEGANYGCEFSGNGKVITALWNSNGSDSVTVAVPLGIQVATIVDRDGQETQVQVENGEVTVDVSQSPRYLIYTNDTDTDGIADHLETDTGTYVCPIDTGTDPGNPDTDDDTLQDGWEVENGLNPLDSEEDNGPDGDPDGDGLNNFEEQMYGSHANNTDTDGDFLGDGDEVHIYGTSPAQEDTDGDELSDCEEVNYDGDPEYTPGADTDPSDQDTDGDQMMDGWEVTNGLDPLDPLDETGDPDIDGLSNFQEFAHGTDPRDKDTDDDTLIDGDEIAYYRTGPTSTDSDGDTLRDGDEKAYWDNHTQSSWDGDCDGDSITNIMDSDSDDDGWNDGQEVRHGSDPCNQSNIPPIAGQWQFDAGFGPTAADTTPYGRNGALHGAWWTVGIVNHALHFNGQSGYVEVAHADNLNLDQELTLLSWIFAHETAGARRIISKKNSYWLRLIDGKIDAGFWFETTQPQPYDTSNFGSVSPGTWHLVAVTFDSSLPDDNIKFYIDGEFVGAENAGSGDRILPNDLPLQIGAWADYGEYFSGKIDEATIYDTAFTSEKIKEIYRRTSIAAYWPLDENGGCTVFDNSENANHGTVYGAGWAQGISGSALKLDGRDDYADALNSSSLRLADAMTLECWIHPHETSGVHRLISKKNGYWLRLIDGKIDAGLTFEGEGLVDTINAGSVTPGAWHHVAVTFDSSPAEDNITLYVNGTPVGSQSAGSGEVIGYNPVELQLGAWSEYTEYFKGRIDEVKIHRRCLTSGEIWDSYQSVFWTPTPTATPTPTLYAETPTPTATEISSPTLTATPALPQVLPVYRFYNPPGRDHLLTISESEKASLMGTEWDYEGVRFYAFGETGGNPFISPLYRLYGSGGGDHCFTTSTSERDTLIAGGWNDEGIGFHVFNSAGADPAAVPVYRLYHPGGSDHLYTISQAERDICIGAGWNDEGIRFYALSSPPAPTTTPTSSGPPPPALPTPTPSIAPSATSTAIPQPLTMIINFQTETLEVPEAYYLDVGAPYGWHYDSGSYYGWR